MPEVERGDERKTGGERGWGGGGEDQREREVCRKYVLPPPIPLPSTVTPVPFISMRATGACATLKTLDTPPPPHHAPRLTRDTAAG